MISVQDGEIPIEYHEEPRPTSYTNLEPANQQYTTYSDNYQQTTQFGMISGGSSRDTSPPNVVSPNDVLLGNPALNSPYPSAPSRTATQMLYNPHDGYVQTNQASNSQILYANNPGYVSQYVTNGNMTGEIVDYHGNNSGFNQGNAITIGMSQYPSPSSQWNPAEYDGKFSFLFIVNEIPACVFVYVCTFIVACVVFSKLYHHINNMFFQR